MTPALATTLHDPDRLAALHRLALLDSPIEAAFERLTRLAVTFLAAPTALVSLVDADRQFFKSCIGLAEPWASLRETPLSHSFCQHAMAARAPMLINDARSDPRVHDNPAIRDLQAISYIGVPLITSDGHALGAFCVIDTAPRVWTEADLAVVQDLAAGVMAEIELRSEVIARQEAEAEARAREQRFRLLAQNSPDIIYIIEIATGRLVYLNRDDMLGYTRDELAVPGSIFAAQHPDDRERVAAHWQEALVGATTTIDYRLRSKAGVWEWLRSRKTIVERAADGTPTHVLGTVSIITERKAIEAHLRLLESVVVSANDGVMVTEPASIDQPMPRIVYVNDAFTAMTGYQADEALGQSPEILHGPQTEQAMLDQLRTALDQQRPARLELVNYRKDGSSFWADISIVPLLDAHGWQTHWIAIQRDITARKLAELLDRDRAHVLELIAQHQPLPTVLTQLCLLIERQRPEMFASILLLEDGRLYEGAAPSLPPTYRAALNGVAIGPLVGSCGTAAATGKPAISSDIATDPRWTDYRGLALAHNLRACWSAPILANTGAVLGAFALYYSVPAEPGADDLALLMMVSQLAAIAIEQQQLAGRLVHQAYHDVLTGLPNRALFRDRLVQQMAQARRQRSKVAVLFIDLDRFKPINDTLGHPVGDLVLQQVAERFGRHLRSSDTLARISGDEFTVILAQVDAPQDAVRVGRKLLDALALPFRVASYDVFVSASIGISIGPEAEQTAEDLIRQADLAMYRAKTRGRNFVECFAEEMNTAAQARLELETDLRHARERGEFSLHYQPRIDLRSGGIVGVEALLRWQHPLRGPISPGAFIPVAEECGQMIPLGAWVLYEACRQGQAWRVAGHAPLTIAVNVSAVQFAQPDFVETVAEALRRTGFPPQYLELELTESMLMRDLAGLVDRLRALRNLGVTIAVDDFGTGYSSLAYLQRLPLDRIKIDQMFVRELAGAISEQAGLEPSANHSHALVETIVTLAHSLRLEAVAEGVEQPEQVAILKQLGCEQAQGYLFARPLPAADLDEWLRCSSGAQPRCAEVG